MKLVGHFFRIGMHRQIEVIRHLDANFHILFGNFKDVPQFSKTRFRRETINTFLFFQMKLSHFPQKLE